MASEFHPSTLGCSYQAIGLQLWSSPFAIPRDDPWVLVGPPPIFVNPLLLPYWDDLCKIDRASLKVLIISDFVKHRSVPNTPGKLASANQGRAHLE